jgi:hypothetical protein
MKNLRFVCAQPCIPYYTWQVEVMIHNFMEMGINPNNIDVVCVKQHGKIPDDWIKLAEHYNYVRFFFYDDTRINKYYTSSIRPNVLKQHWEARPELKDETIFYHDCDIAITNPISNWITTEMINDNNWYGSDCRWYISHSYIKSKGDDILKAMCAIMNIDDKLVEKNELNGIGAQYIMKGIDYDFWERVEIDCERLFTNITELNRIKKSIDPSYHELQIWCADMWAVLWNAWKLGYQTICHDSLEFSWATSPKNIWNGLNIFHNAGVTDNKSGLFYKADYMSKLPYNENLDIKEGTTSYEYWKLIQKTGKKSILL